jgi:hypothetical protein
MVTWGAFMSSAWLLFSLKTSLTLLSKVPRVASMDASSDAVRVISNVLMRASDLMVGDVTWLHIHCSAQS